MSTGGNFFSHASSLRSSGEAEYWFVRLLEPDCAEEDRVAFQRWLAADPAHSDSYRAVETLWSRGHEAIKHPAVAAAAMQALRPRPSSAVRWRRRWVWPAAALVAAAVVAAVVLPHWGGPREVPAGTRYATETGQQNTVRLPDGSSVILDTGTVVVEHYDKRERRVDLQQGQVEFHVQGDPAWPFVVHTQAGTVTAVGTKFQMRMGERGTTVTLLDGELAIATLPKDEEPQFATISSGQQLAYDKAGRIGPIHSIDRKLARGWTEGKLFVHDWRLPDLLAEMNRYTDAQLVIGDPSLRDVRISGVFRTGDQKVLIRALQQGWSIHAEQTAGKDVVLSRQ